MSGLHTVSSKRKKEILAVTAVPPQEGDFVWDGHDEDDRPLSSEEMRAGIRRAGGRPKSSNPRKQLTIRLSPEVVDAFRASGKGWQTRIDAALKDWLKEHSPA